MTSAATKVSPGYRTSQRPMYQTCIANDALKAPEMMRDYSESYIDVESVSPERYTSLEFFQLEEERMWPRVWQMACRVEQVPQAGDCVVYESPGASILVVRGDDEQIRAFYNRCPHRGMKLCRTDTSVSKFTCPYHSMVWNLDGSLKSIPQRWDFPRVEDRSFGLAPVKSDIWGGFVFINRDPNSVPLKEYLGHLVPHFDGWDRNDVYAASIIRKSVAANWKICIEGFMEAYHLSGVHSQALAFGGDSSVQYDVWPDDPHTTRFLQPLAFQSDQYPQSVDQQEILDAAVAVVFGPQHKFTLAPGQTARQFLTAAIRAAASQADGKDYNALSDAEVTDAIQYSVFPNFVLFRSLPYPLAYRFVPVPGDPSRTYFDMLTFKPRKPGEAPPETHFVELGPTDSYASAGVLPPWLAHIYDQDASAFPFVQAGLRDGGSAPVMYSSYQEVRLRHLHAALSRYIGMPPLA